MVYTAPTGVQFANEIYDVSESSDGILVEIIFSPNLPNNATLTLLAEEINGVYGTDYTTLPAVKDGKIQLPVTKGTGKATLRILPVNNLLFNDARCIKLSFQADQETFISYTKSQTTIQLIDDEVSSKITMEPINVSFPENYSKPYEAILKLEPAASADGFAEIIFNSNNSIYGTHFSTTPSSADGIVRIPVAAGTEQVSFSITPIDNAVFNPARRIVFKIHATSDNLKPAGNTQFDLSISNEDE